jgi:hypothetical protein
MEETIPNLSSVEVSQEPAQASGKLLPIILSVIVIGLGVLTGYFFAGKEESAEVTAGGTGVVSEEKIIAGAEFGIKDTSTFKDTATGVLEEGGHDGEGTHKLIREGGPSQTVYLTSSVLDLSQFAGRKIQVWGQTMTAQKVAWLMDVGKIKVLE